MEIPENLDIPVPGMVESPDAGIGGDNPTPEIYDIDRALEAVKDLEPEPEPSLILENDEFQRRVEVIMNAIHPDNPNADENLRRLYAEVHTYLSMFDQGIRQSMVDIAGMGGPFAMIRRMMGGKSKDD